MLLIVNQLNVIININKFFKGNVCVCLFSDS